LSCTSSRSGKGRKEVTRKINVDVLLEEGSRRNYLTVIVQEEVTDRNRPILELSRAEVRSGLEALAATLKSVLL